MGTDGIDDSYANSEEMYVLYRSILAIFAEHGRETGESEIQAFLPELSRKGSGDDVSIAGIVSAKLSVAFIEVLKAQCEYFNAKEQREQAERGVTLAAEKKEYVLSAMKKAKMNYDLCVQKAKEAQKAIEVARHTQEDAIKRFEVAEITLSTAVATYQSSIVFEKADEVIVEIAPAVTEDIVGETAAVEQEEVAIQDAVCEKPAVGRFSLEEADEIKTVGVGCADDVICTQEENAQPVTGVIQASDNGEQPGTENHKL